MENPKLFTCGSCGSTHIKFETEITEMVQWVQKKEPARVVDYEIRGINDYEIRGMEGIWLYGTDNLVCLTCLDCGSYWEQEVDIKDYLA